MIDLDFIFAAYPRSWVGDFIGYLILEVLFEGIRLVLGFLGFLLDRYLGLF